MWPLDRYRIIRCSFCFGSAGEDLFHDVADDEDRTVELVGRVVGTERLLRVARTRAEIMETDDSGARFGLG